jgi:hypothetical protein
MDATNFQFVKKKKSNIYEAQQNEVRLYNGYGSGARGMSSLTANFCGNLNH